MVSFLLVPTFGVFTCCAPGNRPKFGQILVDSASVGTFFLDIRREQKLARFRDKIGAEIRFPLRRIPDALIPKEV